MKKGRKLSLLLAVVMVISILSAVQLPVQAITTLYEPLSTRSLSNPSSPYGYRTDPITGQQGTFHYGIDVPAAYGTPVRAVYGGNVVYASWKDSYGNIVIIYHEALGIYTFYCHLSSFNSSAGNTVNAGDTIAYVGSTGDSTGNHLHFGMCTWLENYWPRSYVNPTPGVNYNYSFDLSQVTGGSSGTPTIVLPSMSDGLTSKLVTPFTNSTLREQLDAVKEEYPSGSSTFNYSCDNGTGSWGFVSYVAYCLYGLVYPSTVTGTLPTSSWNATADSTVTLASSSEWSRVGYIHPTDLANSVAATVSNAATGGYFYRNALPGDVLLLKMSNGYTYAALLEYIDAYGITIYTCNIPTYSPSYAVNSLEFTWNDFVEAFPGPIQIYRPSDARKYSYYNEPTHIVASDVGTFTLGNGNLNTEQEYFPDYNGILSTQFSIRDYTHPADEIVNLGNVSVGENETTTLTFYVANNNFIKNQYGYLTGLDARAELTLSSNAAQITRLDFTNSTSVSSLCSVTLTIKGLTASGASTVYIKNGYGNLAKITLTVEGTAVPVTGVSLDQSQIILNPDDTQTLTATVAPADATNKNVSWTSTGSAVYITPDGVVTAVSPGTAIITATTADGNKTASCTVTVLAVHTVGAEVHYNYSEGGSVSGGGSFSEGEQVTLSASENEGYVFDRWIDENGTFISADKEYTFTITEDVYLYAMYREVKDPVVTVDFLKSRGAVSGLAYLGKYETGSIVSLTAAPLSGYEFEGWFINGELVESGNTYTFTVFENVRIYAKFS